MKIRYLRMKTTVTKSQRQLYRGVTLVVAATPDGRLKVVAAYYGEEAP
jgi:hypothetical protein